MVNPAATNMRSGRWMIYGANGYTGKLTAREAKRRGMRPILAGRNGPGVEALARELGFESRAFDLADPGVVAENLKEVSVVLHCAGPFSATSAPMLAGCARGGCHYLDITGEIDVFEYAHQRDAEWKRAGIITMPGVGFDVVPSDCLAAMLKRELPDATHLRLAFKGINAKFSPGTTRTAIEGLPHGARVRKNGKIVPAPFRTEMIPFEDQAEPAALLPWGDVSTAFYSTGIPNIEVFLGGTEREVNRMNLSAPIRWVLGLGPVQSIIKAIAKSRIRGPSEGERKAGSMLLWGEAVNDAGKRVSMRMKTTEGYNFTVDSSLAAVERVLAGGIPAGALTPSMAFGADFVLHLAGVSVGKTR